ncbi:rna splicing factor prp9 [Pyrrhoderma noxium]|uniref:Rna splicing factor prp9 n=1 Tax=Pyrrhoderma noxium TaxID=2282107 RepID=A0A286UNS7_9AGAM|nr:rna splicing factor prp9 [Pyrrhoderma noxium]
MGLKLGKLTRKLKANEHKASQILDRITSRAHTLYNQYQDEPTRKKEAELLSGKKADDLSEFYSRLGRIKEYHLKYPDQVIGGFELELAALVDDEVDENEEDEYEEEDPISLLFSGEEAYGRYLDLYVHHSSYVNLKNINKRLSYLQYLDVLALAEHDLVHQEIPKEARTSKEYENYINALHAYLLSFTKKTQPLVDISSQQRAAEAEFDVLWSEGNVTGWSDVNKDKQNGVNDAEGIWCSACQKHYSKQTVYDAHLTSKKHVKAAARQATSEAPPVNPNGITSEIQSSQQQQNTKESRIRSSALQTFLTTKLLSLLVPTIAETKSNVERRFSLTAKEREAELAEKPAPVPVPTTIDENGNEEEEEERIYNPLKLPLGWDGKPIPYWLYKLHGLGVEYRCEICSDHVYMGRKNFDRHFQESRHAFGMRALGLPNTKHFHEITKIEDALALAEKLKREGKQEIFQQETMEELEDDEGNVYNRKTYDDLKKQGLI